MGMLAFILWYLHGDLSQPPKDWPIEIRYNSLNFAGKVVHEYSGLPH